MKRNKKVYLRIAISTVGWLALSAAVAGGLWLKLEPMGRNPAGNFEELHAPNSRHSREKQPLSRPRLFESARGKSSLSAAEATNKTGIPSKRGRWIVLHPEALPDNLDPAQSRAEWLVEMAPFEDTRLTVHLQRASNLEVNHGLYVGTVQGHPESQVRLTVMDRSMDGTIRLKNRLFRILDAGSGLHLVVEAEP